MTRMTVNGPKPPPYWKAMYEHALAELNDMRVEFDTDRHDRYLSPCKIHEEQLPGCVRCLVRDKDAFRAEVQRLEHNEQFFGAEAARLEEANASLTRLLADTQRYMDHQRDCSSRRAANVPCTCGYARLIAKLGEVER